MAAIAPTTIGKASAILNQTAQADTGQTTWYWVPNWAKYAIFHWRFISTTGTTPTCAIVFLTADPVLLDDSYTCVLQETVTYTTITSFGGQSVVWQVGPNITGLTNDNMAAGGDSYATINCVLPPIIGISVTLDRAEADETYTYTCQAQFRKG